MTVKQLIEELKKYPQDMEVATWGELYTFVDGKVVLGDIKLSIKDLEDDLIPPYLELE